MMAARGRIRAFRGRQGTDATLVPQGRGTLLAPRRSPWAPWGRHLAGESAAQVLLGKHTIPAGFSNQTPLGRHIIPMPRGPARAWGRAAGVPPEWRPVPPEWRPVPRRGPASGSRATFLPPGCIPARAPHFVMGSTDAGDFELHMMHLYLRGFRCTYDSFLFKGSKARGLFPLTLHSFITFSPGVHCWQASL